MIVKGQETVNDITGKRALLGLVVLAIAVVGGAGAEGGGNSGRVDAEAAAIVQRFCQYIQGLSSFSVDVTVSMSGSVGTMRLSNSEMLRLSVARPNRMSVDYRTGVVPLSVVSDGTRLYTYLAQYNQYVIEEAPERWTELFESARPAAKVLEMKIPLVESILREDSYEAFMKDVVGGEKVGEEEIEGVKCHHLKFSQAQMDWEIWLTKGEKPLIRKIVPKLSSLGQSSEMWWRFDNWRFDKAAADEFKIVTAVGAEQVAQFYAASQEPPHPMVGEQAKNFDLALLGGEKMELGAHKGKDIVVLDFWATWCRPCQVSLPKTMQIIEQFKGKGVVFYGVNLREQEGQIREFLEKAGLKFTVALDRAGETADAYRVEGIPHMVIVGKQGKVQSVHVGADPGAPARLKRELEALVAGKDLAGSVEEKARYDLYCKSVKFLPAEVKVGDKVGFECVLGNSGRSPVRGGTYKLGLIISGRQVFYGVSPLDIAGGGEVSYSVPPEVWRLQVGRAGSHSYQVVVDFDNLVAESNERNNVFRGSFEVAEKDTGE